MLLNFLTIKKSYQTAIYIIAAIIILLLILLGILYWNWQQSSQDDLAKLIPGDVQFYAHLNYQPARLTDSKAGRLFDYLFQDLDNYFLNSSTLKFNPNLKKYLDHQLGIALDKNNNWFLILKVKNSKELISQLAGQAQFSLLAGRYLIITKNPDTFSQIEKTKANPALSLAKKIPWQKNYDRNIIKIYAQPLILDKIIGNQLAGKFLQTYISENDLAYFYFSANNNLDFFIKTNNQFKSATKLITEQLPANSVLTVAANNLLDFTQNFTGQLKKFNPDLYWQLLASWQNYEASYHFSFTEIEPLINHSAQLIITQAKNQPTKYILILQTTGQEDLMPLENILKNIVARHFPKKVAKTLPDGTKVNELVSDPKNFHLEEIRIGENIIKIVKNTKPIWELAYTRKNNQLIISNSLTALEDLLIEKNQLILKKNCPNLPTPNFFIKPLNLVKNKSLEKYEEILGGLSVNLGKNIILGCFK